jgi:hypothetical protein
MELTQGSETSANYNYKLTPGKYPKEHIQKFEPVYRPSNFNTGFGHEKSVRQDGSKEPHD